MKPEVECSLVVNVARGDVPLLEHTIPHILSSHKVRFAEVLLIVDETGAVGRLAKQKQYRVQELQSALDRVRDQGYRFRQVTVDFRPKVVQSIYEKWFDKSEVSLRCAGGTPIYAFLFGLEQAQCDHRLHVDVDMLFYDPGPRSWVQQALKILQEIEVVLFVNQAGGPHRTPCPRPEHIAAFDDRVGLHIDGAFSTRCFLYSDRKLRERFLPISAVRHSVPRRLKYYLQGRSSYMALEQMLAAALRNSKFSRCDLDRSWGFNLHAGVEKHRFLEPRIKDIIDRVQRGDTPQGQCGYYDLVFESFFELE
jgi:hypothetical protein